MSKISTNSNYLNFSFNISYEQIVKMTELDLINRWLDNFERSSSYFLFKGDVSCSPETEK